MDAYGTTPQPPAAPKKSNRGCIIALVVAGGVTALGAIGVIVGVALFAESDAGKKIIKVVGKGAEIAQKGMAAPGAAEVRALGCEQALVVDMRDFAELTSEFVDADVSKIPDQDVVTCQASTFRKAPTCDAIATTYVRAVGRARGSFIVTVTRQGSSKPECTGMYDAAGSPVPGTSK
jgi:hypothetical protein